MNDNKSKKEREGDRQEEKIRQTLRKGRKSLTWASENDWMIFPSPTI